jgi:hypothetical protein
LDFAQAQRTDTRTGLGCAQVQLSGRCSAGPASVTSGADQGGEASSHRPCARRTDADVRQRDKHTAQSCARSKAESAADRSERRAAYCLLCMGGGGSPADSMTRPRAGVSTRCTPVRLPRHSPAGQAQPPDAVRGCSRWHRSHTDVRWGGGPVSRERFKLLLSRENLFLHGSPRRRGRLCAACS